MKYKGRFGEAPLPATQRPARRPRGQNPRGGAGGGGRPGASRGGSPVKSASPRAATGQPKQQAKPVETAAPEVAKTENTEQS